MLLVCVCAHVCYVLLTLNHRSAKSHVLEEPVPRASSTNTLPWNCTLCDGSIIALHGASTARYIIEPLSVTISVADQQGGTGVTIHTDLVALSLSKIEVYIVCVCVCARVCLFIQ